MLRLSVSTAFQDSLSGAQVGFGDSHRIVGSTEELGQWNVDSAPAMSWSEGDVWTLDLDLPAGRSLEFKARQHDRHVHSAS